MRSLFAHKSRLPRGFQLQFAAFLMAPCSGLLAYIRWDGVFVSLGIAAQWDGVFVSTAI